MNKLAFNRPEWSTPLFVVLALVIGGGLGLATILLGNPILVVTAVLAPIFLLICVYRPEWSLVGLFILTYTRFSDVTVKFYGAPSTAKLYIVFLLLILIIRILWFGDRPKNWHRAAFVVIIYGLLGAISLLYAKYPTIVQDNLSDFLKDGLIVLILALLLDKTPTLRQVIWALLIAGIFMGTISVYQQLTQTFTNIYWGFGQAEIQNIVGQTNDYRIGGPFGSPNAYSQVMLPLIPLALDRVWNEYNPWLRFLAGWALAATILTVVFTFSRTGFMVMLLMLGLMFIRRPPRLAPLVITFLLLLPLLQFVPDSYMERIGTLADLLPGSGADAREEVSFRGRLSENIAGIQAFSDHPIVGVGWGNFPKYYQEYARHIGTDNRSVERGTHNLYLQIAAEQGLLGLIVMFSLFALIFQGLYQARVNFIAVNLPDYAGIALALSIGLIGYLTAGIFAHLAYPRHFWLLIGLALITYQVSHNELSRKQERLERPYQS
ncbi:MAG: O-antigen ligase family protein [Anaerolineales bacterium]|nr:O-antigen ligase family protein [Anaerolineales bacterium]